MATYFWSLIIAVVAIALLLADGLEALQVAVVASALPFALILLVAIYGLLKALRLDMIKRRIRFLSLARTPPPSKEHDWQERLRNMVALPERDRVVRLINLTVAPAMKKVGEEFEKLSYEVEIQQNISDEGDAEGWLLLVKHHGDYQDFSYLVHPVADNRPALTSIDSKRPEKSYYYRAEVHLSEGGQDYDIMGWSEESIVSDIIEQYGQHRQFLHMVYDNESIPKEVGGVF